MTAVREHKAGKSNRKLVFGLIALPVAMLTLGFASKPLYDAFCRVTGYGGTTRVVEQMSTTILDRSIRVRLDSNVANDLGWTFKPEDTAIDVKLGQNALAYYTATNDTDTAIVGTATYNVTPIKAAPYFSKLECFCFTEQRLEPGETVSMPVLFFVDPEMQNDRRLDEIKSITLSYTFHRVANPSDDVVRTAQRRAQLKKLQALELKAPGAATKETIQKTEEQGRG